MDLCATRYMFEHKVLPHWFYEETKMFINAILADPDFLYDMLGSMCQEDHVQMPYQKEDFSVYPFKITDDTFGIELTLPKPEDTPLCYTIFLIFQEDYERSFYFTVEKGTDENGNDNSPFLCGWNQDECHLNFGSCGLDQKENMIRCSSVFIKNSYTISMENNIHCEA